MNRLVIMISEDDDGMNVSIAADGILDVFIAHQDDIEDGRPKRLEFTRTAPSELFDEDFVKHLDTIAKEYAPFAGMSGKLN